MINKTLTKDNWNPTSKRLKGLRNRMRSAARESVLMESISRSRRKLIKNTMAMIVALTTGG